MILGPQPGLNPHSLHWKVNSPALDPQRSPTGKFDELIVTVKTALQQRTFGLGLDIGLEERAVHWRADAPVHLGRRQDGSCALTRAGWGDGH